MNQNNCFTEIKTKSNGLVLYLEHLISLENLTWQQHFGFDVIFLDDSWIQKELALKQINKIHPIKQLGLLRVKHKSFYGSGHLIKNTSSFSTGFSVIGGFGSGISGSLAVIGVSSDIIKLFG